MTMTNMTYAAQLQAEIGCVRQSIQLYESLIAGGDDRYRGSLKLARQCEQNLWDEYFENQTDSIHFLNADVEKKLLDLQKQSAKINHDVQTLAEANSIIYLVAQLVAVAILL